MEEYFENEAIERFERMIDNHEELFFDSEECEDIISYYLEIGDYRYAEMATQFAERLYPESLSIKVRKLELLLEKGEDLQARNLMKKLKGLADEDLDYLICCARYYSNVGNPFRAIKYCEKALEQEEDQAFLHNFIADEYLNLENYSAALKHYREALKFDKEDQYALESLVNCYSELRRETEAIRFINQFLDENPYSEVAWNQYGSMLYNRKDYEEAVKAFDYLLAINPDSIKTYAQKAACYEAMGSWEKAIETYTESQAHEFTKSYSYYRIGKCFRKLNRPVQALNALQRSVYEDPQFYPAMLIMSQIYEDMGSMNEALHFAKEASRYNQDNLDLQKRLALLYINLGKFEEALISLRRLVDKSPNRFYHWYIYNEVLMMTGEFERSEKSLLTALKLHKRAELYYQLSYCSFELHNDKQGREALAEAIHLDATLLDEMKAKYPLIEKGL